ncbi:MAG TPA: tripartite tricarboxylate transporter substrate binding protein [Xanthobacteraceae bacterium]|nr:tripartite tricarboxylate transporter substrate binding protein [Xanthobacteraceae bacterium]
MTRRFAVALVAALGFALLAGAPARAEYPERLIKVVVGYPPGGPIDTTARIIVPHLSEILGRTIIVENRPGATGTLAAKTFATAQPDGYTLMLGNASSLVVMPAMTRYRDYDSVKSFAPITKLTEGYEVLVVAPDGPKDVPALIAAARANPGKLNFGSAGFGNLTHLAGELLKLKAGIDIMHIPYKGAAEAQTALLAGQIHLMFGEVAGLLPMVRAGKLRALGVASERRNPLAPELPTLIEGGLPDFVALTFTGLMAPAATPPAVVDKLNGAIHQVLAMPDVRTALERLGAEVRPDAPAEFSAFLVKEEARWDEVVRQSGLKME